MSAIAEAISSSLDTLPVCLCPWLENPYKLVSLWDIVIPFSAEKFYWSGLALENLKTACLLKPGAGDAQFQVGILYKPIEEPTFTKASEWLPHVQKECGKIGLMVSSETIAEILERLAAEGEKPHYQWLMNQLDNLQKIIRKEMKSKAFFYIPPEKIRFWPTMKTPYVFGEAVHSAFPSIQFDAAEAGVCLATARATACVFHLMRVLETGLTVLGSIFGVSMAHTNWAPAIGQIEKAIREMHQDEKWRAFPDCKEQQEFYAQAASHFGILKDAWRNYTAHTRGIYTEEWATLIFENTRAFMQILATRLHETVA